MEKEEILLGVEMGRLEIEPIKFNQSRNNDNPFILIQNKNILKTNINTKETRCNCSSQKKTIINKYSGISKKKPYKILKEPMLKLLKTCNNNIFLMDNAACQDASSKTIDTASCDPLNLCTLVDNCNQLTISSHSNEECWNGVDAANESKWWKSSALQESREQRQQNSTSSSCSQQALNPPCDVTIDELASYFETLVHIPKKMSSMAEMMYI